MTANGWRARDVRIARLRALARPTRAQRDELERLERLAADFWRILPRRIATQRRRLADLTAYADEIGLGPC